MIYINASACISPQHSFGTDHFLAETKRYSTNMLRCIEPDYTGYFNAVSLRRMGRVLKMGWAGSKACLDAAGLAVPDAICVGTGKGCYYNTQVFLFSVEENEELFVPPSPFIQSAHGSIAAQIAIQTGCTNHNMTYAHRAFSFESALLDAMMLLAENNCENVLVGGVDEIEEIQFQTFNRLGHYKTRVTDNLRLFSENTPGTIAGEGSTFFLLQSHPGKGAVAGIRGVHTFSNTQSIHHVKSQITDFLRRGQLIPDDLDLVILGLNGDSEFDGMYLQLMDSFFGNTCQASYKHLCGEYHTSSAFALWMAENIIRRQLVPEAVKLNARECEGIKNVLIYNHYRNINHSLMLVSVFGSE